MPRGLIAAIDALRGFDMFWIVGGRELALAVVGLFASPLPRWVEYQFEHPEWEGFSAWDLIMPLFLFVVGIAMPFSFARRTTYEHRGFHRFCHLVRSSSNCSGIRVWEVISAFAFGEQAQHASAEVPEFFGGPLGSIAEQLLRDSEQKNRDPLPRRANRASRAGPANRIFGLLEHLGETRFPVPKVVSFGTPPFSRPLKKQADLQTACSKNARLRASWAKFQKSLPRGDGDFRSGTRGRKATGIVEKPRRKTSRILEDDRFFRGPFLSWRVSFVAGATILLLDFRTHLVVNGPCSASAGGRRVADRREMAFEFSKNGAGAGRITIHLYPIALGGQKQEAEAGFRRRDSGVEPRADHHRLWGTAGLAGRSIACGQ